MRVIAIDGPAGSGKSTVARRLADRLELDYLDTGAMYRSVAFAALRRGIDPSENDKVAKMMDDIEIEVSTTSVMVDRVDATIEIRGPEITRAVSVVAANAAVRRELVARQRAWVAQSGGGVIEGRDIGTVVFPEAELKVYLTARLDIRASRRHKEVSDLDYEQVAADMARRDTLDTMREIDPLQEAQGAVVIDTSDRSIDDIVDEIMGLLSASDFS
ncbi:MAG: (d)CMP kinase [Acidimicrobiales bacterium]